MSIKSVYYIDMYNKNIAHDVCNTSISTYYGLSLKIIASEMVKYLLEGQIGKFICCHLDDID